ncbi:MAG: DegV family protein [Bacteroidota bacterium]
MNGEEEVCPLPRVAIVTDSACDMDRDTLLGRGVAAVVPLTVTIGREEYRDGVDLTREEFYRLLAASPETARTAQPSPGAFGAAYREALQTAAHVVAITLSSGLSGTYESALLARTGMAGEADRVTVFDSRAASIGQALMVMGAAERAATGGSLAEILAFLEDLRAKLASIFTLDTLDYLVRGGRLSRVQGMVGMLLNIKPLLELDRQGRIVPREKVRGRARAIERLLAIVGEEGAGLAGQRVGISHARAAAEAEAAAEEMRRRFGVGEVAIGEISATIGTHTGPGCLAVFFARKAQNLRS